MKQDKNDKVKTLLKRIFICSLIVFGLSFILAIHSLSSNKSRVLSDITSPSKFPNASGASNTKIITPTVFTPTQKATPSPTSSLASTPKVSVPAVTQPAQVPNDFCLNVPVLFYHHVEPLAQAQVEGHAQLTVDSGIFDSQMAYLIGNGYHTISADQLILALLSRQSVPSKSIVVTLDDGYTDWYSYVLPVVKKYNITVSLMIPSGLIANPDYLTWAQLKEMSQSPLVKVYNHTWSHADIGHADRTKVEFELATSQNLFQTQLGFKPTIFTYPYGSYSSLAIDMLREHGFTGAFTTLPGTSQCASSIMVLHRSRIGNAPLSSYGF